MMPRRWYLALLALALAAGTGALWIWTIDGERTFIAYAEPATRLSRDDLYLIASDGRYESQRTQGFRPRRDVAPFPLELPLDWSADPFDDRNWRFSFTPGG
jgi:hypothetical protein